MQSSDLSLKDHVDILAPGIVRHTVAILGAASLATFFLSLTGNAHWAKFLVFTTVAGAVAEGRRWHPARVGHSPWWASALAGVGALAIAGGSFVLARKLGLAAATVASFRVLTVAIAGGLIWSSLGITDRLIAKSVDEIENEGEEVRARLTLPRPKRPINRPS